MSTATEQEQRYISTLILPVSDQYILTPGINVAEIVDQVEPQELSDMPNWFNGKIEWRDRFIPLVSLEGLNDQAFSNSTDEKAMAVIFNGIVNTKKMPFWSLVVNGLPRQAQIYEQELIEDKEVQCGPAEKTTVLFNGQMLKILDLDFVENKLLELNF